MNQVGFQTFIFGLEMKRRHYYNDIHYNLAIKMEENRKCEKLIEFWNIRKGIHIITSKYRFKCNDIYTKLSIIIKD